MPPPEIHAAVASEAQSPHLERLDNSLIEPSLESHSGLCQGFSVIDLENFIRQCNNLRDFSLALLNLFPPKEAHRGSQDPPVVVTNSMERDQDLGLRSGFQNEASPCSVHIRVGE